MELERLTRIRESDLEKDHEGESRIQTLINLCSRDVFEVDYWTKLVVNANHIPNMISILRIKFHVKYNFDEDWCLEKTESFLTKREEKLLREIFVYALCYNQEHILTSEINRIIRKWEIEILPEEIDWFSLGSNTEDFRNYIRDFKDKYNYFSDVLVKCVKYINSELSPRLDAVRIMIMEGIRLSEGEIKYIDDFTGSTKNTEVYKFLVEHFGK